MTADDIIDAEFSIEPTEETSLAVRQQRVPALIPIEIGYFVSLTETKYQDKGELIYVTQVTPTKIHFVSTKSSYTDTPEEFRKLFSYESNGEELYQGLLFDAMREVSVVQVETGQQSQALLEYNPHIEEDGSESTDIVIAGGVPVASKRAISLMRNEVQKGRMKMQAAAERVQSVMKMQTGIIEAQMKQLEMVVKKAQEAVWTINLYLGTEEEIVTLRTGTPAPDEAKITMRQLVLFMDEECAISAEKGGIDALSMTKFDAWLLSDPKHLAQIFPEEKGIVALVPKRYQKDYGDPWRNNQMSEANGHTYFLLRNGENLYRMDTEFEVGTVLVPREDEFVSMFKVVKRKYKGTGAGFDIETEEVILTPGSEDYMKAMEASDARQRHFYRVALLLQGLIDRTTIFAPMAEAIKVTDPRSYGRTINLIKDAERGLSDGRERFTEWRERINSGIGVGTRIIGIFNNWSHGLQEYRDKEGNCSRITPKRSSYPKDSTIYTLEGRRSGGYYFYYDRVETRLGETYSNRASCVVVNNDDFILNLDAADVETMRGFLSNRLDRHNYAHMFDIIKVAIGMKEQEEKEEAPFRQLLVGQIMQTYNTDFDNAASLVPELVQWWKFKNKYHRSLLSDDSKALNMIVTEAGSRIKEQRVRAENRVNGYYTRIIGRIRDAEPKTMLVAHKTGNTYVALVPENDHNVFLKEQTWVLKEGEVRLTEERRWRTLGTKTMRGDVIYENPLVWGKWDFDATNKEYITDDELAAALPNLMEKAESRILGALTSGYDYHSRKDTREKFYKLMAVTRNVKGHVSFYYFSQHTNVPENLNVFDTFLGPTLSKCTAYFARVSGGNLEWEYNLYGNEGFGLNGERPWEDRPNYGGRKEVVLAISENNVDEAWKEVQQYQAFVKKVQDIKAVVRKASLSVWAQMKNKIEMDAYHQFIQEFGDPELWEGHKKTLNGKRALASPDKYLGDVETMLEHCLQLGIDIQGKRVDALAAQCKNYGIELSGMSPEISMFRVSYEVKE